MKNKKTKIILSVSKQRLASYLKPKMLHLDHGWKFRNKMMQNCLKENNIDYIIEGPYNSQHQEQLNHLIKLSRFLISAKDHQGIFLID